MLQRITLFSALWITFSAPCFAADEADEIVPQENATPPITSGGAGDLLVAPTRIVLEGRTRSAEIVLSNTGNKESTYRISLIHLHMDDNGKYEEKESTGDKYADDLLRYSPRQVTLKPGASQTVRVMARKPEGMADGEYRSHMIFRAVPDDAVGEDVEKKTADDGQISIRLIPVYGVSIPIIVRQGDLSAKASLSNATVSGKNLLVTISRSGNESVYGDIVATHNGKIVGEMHGIAVFTPNTRRTVSLPLNEAPSGGALDIEYVAREAKNQTIAKTSLKL